jgi:hypothetical protein
VLIGAGDREGGDTRPLTSHGPSARSPGGVDGESHGDKADGRRLHGAERERITINPAQMRGVRCTVDDGSRSPR